jgi:4-hydroxy-3-polyprenylbenzoate decarboxylase
MSRSKNAAIAVGITGASGVQYGMRLIECLIAAGHRVQVMFTKTARIVVGSETDWKLPPRAADTVKYLSELWHAAPGQLRVFGEEEWTAPVASGSGVPRALVICPCSMAMLSSIAQGSSRNLMERAADVVLKEGRRLILVPRETPFSAIHLENMLKLARLGVTILPANPGFYARPTQLSELVDFIVARVLDQLDIDHQLGPRWGSEEPG